MSIHHHLIRFPSITEKNTNLRVNQNKYVFEVATHASKPMIKKAVEELFNVKVEAVNTMNVRGKYRRPTMRGRQGGYRPDWKKAIVKVQKGQSIGEFGSV
jgi:large subunit ribosomal protein L23